MATPVPVEATSTPNWASQDSQAASTVVKAWYTEDRALFDSVAALRGLKFPDQGGVVLLDTPVAHQMTDSSGVYTDYEVETRGKLPDGRLLTIDNTVYIDNTTHRATIFGAPRITFVTPTSGQP